MLAHYCKFSECEEQQFYLVAHKKTLFNLFEKKRGATFLRKKRYFENDHVFDVLTTRKSHANFIFFAK